MGWEGRWEFCGKSAVVALVAAAPTAQCVAVWPVLAAHAHPRRHTADHVGVRVWAVVDWLVTRS